MKKRIRLEVWDGNFGPHEKKGENWNWQIEYACKQKYRTSCLVEIFNPAARGTDGRRIVGRFSTPCDALECKRVCAFVIRRMKETYRKIENDLTGTKHKKGKTK